MQFRRNAGLSEREVKADAVLGWNRCIGGRMKQKSRRRLRSDAQVVRKIFHEFRVGFFAQKIVARSDVRILAERNYSVRENREMGRRAHAIDRVRCTGIPRIEVRCRGRSKMAAREKSPDADEVGINV